MPQVFLHFTIENIVNYEKNNGFAITWVNICIKTLLTSLIKLWYDVLTEALPEIKQINTSV